MCQARAAARDYARARTQGFGKRGSRVLGHAHRVGRTRTRGGSASLEGLAGLAEPSKRVGWLDPWTCGSPAVQHLENMFWAKPGGHHISQRNVCAEGSVRPLSVQLTWACVMSGSRVTTLTNNKRALPPCAHSRTRVRPTRRFACFCVCHWPCMSQ